MVNHGWFRVMFYDRHPWVAQCNEWLTMPYGVAWLTVKCVIMVIGNSSASTKTTWETRGRPLGQHSNLLLLVIHDKPMGATYMYEQKIVGHP